MPASRASGASAPRFIACQPPVVTSAPELNEVTVIVPSTQQSISAWAARRWLAG
jgi:hypothetical protein